MCPGRFYTWQFHGLVTGRADRRTPMSAGAEIAQRERDRERERERQRDRQTNKATGHRGVQGQLIEPTGFYRKKEGQQGAWCWCSGVQQPPQARGLQRPAKGKAVWG